MNPKQVVSLRPAVAFSFILVLLLIPTVRLIKLALGSEYRDAAVTQSRQELILCELRGTIYDRNGISLTNEPTGFAASEFLPSYPVYRRYTSIAPHLIGYPTSARDNGYTGLEGAFSDILEQYRGAFTVSYPVDAAGERLSGVEPTVEDTLSLSKGGIVLTLDAELQVYAQQQLKGLLGGIVVMDTSGELLAMTSSPGFDQNELSSALDKTDSPLLDRTLSAYDVGSVFKTVVTAAALEAGISPGRCYTCKGQIDVKGVVIRCHRHSGHGEQDLKTAFCNSCNPYFIDLALELGAESILSMARSMGFSESISLAEGISSKAGSLPTEADLSVPAALANLAIGQGTLMATPLQIAAAVNCVATGGDYLSPRLLLREVDEFGHTVDEAEASLPYRVMSEDTTACLLDIMASVFDETLSQYAPTGGAAGKTSTAQTGIVGEDGHKVCQTWLAGVWPAKEPRYTVVVFVEDGISGSVSCGPVFQSVCQYLADHRGSG